MKQAYLADAVAGVPASTGAASVGNPSDGDPAGGVEATALGAYAMFQIFTEIEAVIAEGGLTADVDTLTQLRDAVQAMIDASGFDQVAGDARYLRRGQNLGDVGSSGTSRGNIGAAPINNPAFTGNPTAPTQSPGNESRRLATTAFVAAGIDAAAPPDGIPLATRNEHLANSPPTNEAAVPAYVLDMIERAIANLIDSAPGALDTLNELAAALDDDADFHTAITNALALKANIDGAPANRDTLDQLYDVLNAAIRLKANIASPTLTGNPRAPTPSTSDDDTSIATTGFVQNVRDALLMTIEDGAPSSRDTLDELYDVLNAAIALKANIAAPQLTGNARTSTPPDDDDSTRIATTGWVRDNGGGIGRPAFFSLSDNVRIDDRTDVFDFNYEASRAGAVLGFQLQAAVNRDTQLRIGTAGDSEALLGLTQIRALRAFLNQFFLHKPGTASSVNYRVNMVSSGNGPVAYKGTSLIVFELPQTVVADVRSTRITTAGQGMVTVATVAVTPRSSGQVVALRFAAIGGTAGRVRILRGSIELITTPSAGEAAVLDASPSDVARGYPHHLEYWMDSPGTTNEVTYSLQVEGNTDSRVGTYLLAELL